METVRAHLKITGRVQGVGYRYFVRDVANALHITGWAANRYDGSVEVLAEGEREAISRFLQYCRRGPSLAHVEDMDVSWEEPTGDFTGFGVR